MRRILLLVGKDLRRRWRSPLGAILILAFPLIFSAMIALAFGGGEPRIPRVRLLVQNDDDGVLGALLTGAASSDRMAQYFDVQDAGGRGPARMERGEASALLVIPKTFSRDILNGKAVALRLVRNPAEGILPEVAEQSAAVLADVLSSASRALRGPLDELAPVFDSDSTAPSDAMVSTLAAEFNRVLSRGGKFVFPPAIVLETSTASTPAVPKRSRGFPSVFVLVLPGVSVFALFMLGDLAMRDILTESAAGTLRRQLCGPLPVLHLIVAKTLYAAVLAGIGVLILAGVALAFARRAADPLGFLVLSAALVVAVAGFGAVVYGIARNESQGATFASIAFMVMAFIGGGFISVESLPAAVRAVAPFTLFYWPSVGFRRLLAEGAGFVDVLPSALVLGTAGVLMTLGGAALLRRRVLAGRAR